MNLLLYGEIRQDAPMPGFGGAFAEHMQLKRNPDVRAASLSAWNLLADGLRSMGIETLPEIGFEEAGRPVFTGLSLHFSLSHSGSIAAALISDRPCGVDVQLIRPEIAEKLSSRVLSEDEQRRGCDFFEIWTKKEAAGKLSGSGIPSHPRDMNLEPFKGLNWQTMQLSDKPGRNYLLSAVCEDPAEIKTKDCV